LRYSVFSNMMTDTASRLMVSECMKLASRTASRFCTEYDVPAIRRAGYPLEIFDPSKLQSILDIRDEFNYVEALPVVRAGFFHPRAEYTTTSAPHWGLGIPAEEGYMRVTSPLRRYTDIVGHWQIKCALFRAAGSKDGDKLPFSDDALRFLIKDITHSEHILKRAYKYHQSFWAHLYISQYLNSQLGITDRPDALKNLYAYTTRAERYDPTHMRTTVEIFIPSLGLGAKMKLDSGRNLLAGMELRVNVTGVLMGLTPQLLIEEL